MLLTLLCIKSCLYIFQDKYFKAKPRRLDTLLWWPGQNMLERARRGQEVTDSLLVGWMCIGDCNIHNYISGFQQLVLYNSLDPPAKYASRTGGWDIFFSVSQTLLVWFCWGSIFCSTYYLLKIRKIHFPQEQQTPWQSWQSDWNMCKKFMKLPKLHVGSRCSLVVPLFVCFFSNHWKTERPFSPWKTLPAKGCA